MAKTYSAQDVLAQLDELGDAKVAEQSLRFFKTGEGEYGYGDQFVGVKVPQIRKLVLQYRDLPLVEVLKLLRNEIHEARLLAVLLMVRQYSKGDSDSKQKIFDAYLANTRWINNWDIVDSSAPHVVGAHLYSASRKVLYKLVRSKDLWERRIAILATQYFLRKSDFDDTLELSRLLLNDREDLIHKATGWMLREMGKKSAAPLYQFLDEHAAVMPRTMLRYSIEKLGKDEKRYYMELIKK